MSDTFKQKDYTKVTLDVANDVISEWESTCKEFDGARLKANEDATFKVLEEIGVSGGFPARYDTAMEGIINGIVKEIGAAKAAIESISDADKKLSEQKPIPPGGGPNNDQEEEPVGVDNLTDQETYYKNLSVVDLDALCDYLNKASQELKMPLDELLANEEQGSKLIEVLLQRPDLSEKFKDLLTEGKTEVSLVALKNFIKGEYKTSIGFDDKDTLLTFKTYLANIVNGDSDATAAVQPDANTLTKTLIKDLKPIASNLKGITKENIQDKISSIYRGNYADSDKIADETQALIGTNIDVLANSNKLYYEDLLSDNTKQDLLLKSVEKLQRASIYSNLLSSCKDPTGIMSSLLK